MGGGSYCSTTRSSRASSMGYYSKSVNEIFTQKTIKNEMDPHGVTIRESRDSEEHPESLAIIIALDVTGSMGMVPHMLVKDGFPKLMQMLIDGGIKDPQVLFLAIGDHECDIYPLQVGQFESSDELLDKWLTTVYLEGGGGANRGESYHLAWYFSAYHTSIDCFEKRNQKGFLFTIGDEPTLEDLPGHSVKNIMGGQGTKDLNIDELLMSASKSYNVFHVNVCETPSGSQPSTVSSWENIIKDNLMKAQRTVDIPGMIASTVINRTRSEERVIVQNDLPDVIEKENIEEEETETML